MDNKIILKAEDLDGYLTAEDMSDLKNLEVMFKETMKFFDPLNEEKIIEGYDKLGHEMQKICSKHPAIKVYSFVTKKVPMQNVPVLFLNYGMSAQTIRNLCITASVPTKCFSEWLTQISIAIRKDILL